LKITAKIFEIITKNASEKELEWVDSKIKSPASLSVAFVATPRFISKKLLQNLEVIEEITLTNWSLDRLVRVFFLLILEEKTSEIDFRNSINTLFETAEINESVALYSALPFFKNPENWLLKATDAVRSNIGDVFDSLAFNNPYPSKYFPELAWNQLVLKCIFNDKSINNIIGLKDRFNQNLADTFIDFAHERWAAGREVPVEAWQIIEPFLEEKYIADIEHLFKSNSEKNQIAAYILCNNTQIPQLNSLLKKYHIELMPFSQKTLKWDYFQSI
jgi:hypothetical protein